MISAAQLLLDHDAVDHVRNKFGHTPLHLGWCGGHSDIVLLLAEHWANAEERGGDRNTPLHVAAVFGKVSTVQLLLKDGAVLDVRNELGQTPLHYASWGGYSDIVLPLLEHGAHVGAQDGHYDTSASSSIPREVRSRQTAARTWRSSSCAELARPHTTTYCNVE